MKIRHPLLIHAAGRLAALTARGLVGSLTVRLHCQGETTLPVGDTAPGARYIYAVWHENLLVPAMRYGHPDLAALVSRHADGQILTTLLRSRGLEIVPGSTNRGGVEAVRRIVSGSVGRRHLVITPDGPRGPRRQVQGGIAYAASRTGARVVPLGFAYQKSFRLKSWDRFAVPRPGSTVYCVAGSPVTIADRLRGAELDAATGAVQQSLDAATVAAEAWERGQVPS